MYYQHVVYLHSQVNDSDTEKNKTKPYKQPSYDIKKHIQLPWVNNLKQFEEQMQQLILINLKIKIIYNFKLLAMRWIDSQNCRVESDFRL